MTVYDADYAQHIFDNVKAALKRLQTDYIDVLEVRDYVDHFAVLLMICCSYIVLTMRHPLKRLCRLCMMLFRQVTYDI